MTSATKRNDSGTTSTVGPELLVDLESTMGAPSLGAQLERGLRDAVRSGRLAPGARLPSSRTFARDLGVSRRLVVEAYAQLVAEGWLVARQGSGTRVAPSVPGVLRSAVLGVVTPFGPVASTQEPPAAGAPPRCRRPRYDFFPGTPDLATFPRALWLRTVRQVLQEAPDAAFGYPDPSGTSELRGALAPYLARVRGVVGLPDRIVVATGARQGLALVVRALVRRDGAAPRVAVEVPSLPIHRQVLTAAGAEVVGVPVDGDGLDVAALAATGADAVLVTPAHQFPLGVALAPERRAALLAWAAAGDRLVVEDDYDAEFRYDRRPLAALQGQAPEHVAYLGSASKAIAPGLRIGWLVLPASLHAGVSRAKELEDGGSPVLDQLVLAKLIDGAGLDRHVRLARRRQRARRDAVAEAVAVHLPGARLEGLAAGLHVIVRLPAPVDAIALRRAALARSVGVYPLAAPDASTADALVLGYAGLTEPAIRTGVRLLGEALADT